MTELTIISSSEVSLQPLIESAIANQLRVLAVGMRQAQHRIHAFEEQFGMTTADFVRRYANNEISETLDTIDWLGEYRMAQRIQEKIDTLKEIRFAH